MSRRKTDPVRKAFSEYLSLNHDQQRMFAGMVEGYELAHVVQEPKPDRAPRKKRTTTETATA